MRSQYVVRAEESLREFILDEYRIEGLRAKDPRQRQDLDIDTYKYRGLTMIIETNAKESIAKFSVQIASAEATFSIETGKKIDGGMPSSDIKLIENWLSISVNRQLMMNIWTGAFKEKFIKLRPFDTF